MANILLVDDALFIRSILKNIIEQIGHTVVGEAATAKGAVDQYEALKPDLMTLDIHMPEIDSIDSLKAIGLILESDPGARIVMVSTAGQKEWLMSCINAGAKDFIVKPFKPMQVVNTVNRVLRMA